MREKILNDLKETMKNQDKQKLSVIRSIKEAIMLEEIKNKSELNDEEVISIIAKQVKTRKESIIEFEKGKRQDLIEKTTNEIKILETYLPEQINLEDAKKLIDEVFQEVNPTSPKDMGKIMGLITPKLKGRFDMKEASQIIKDKINNI